MKLITSLVRKVRKKLRRPIPVIVYQMGKCGSTSIFKSLKSYPSLDVYHIHRMNREYIESVWKEHEERGVDPPYEMDEKGLSIYESIIQSSKNVKIVCPIRDPVSRNISAFFYNFLMELKNRDNLDHLLQEFLDRYPHDVPLKWFQREPKQILDIDVFQTDFPPKKGYKIYSKGTIDMLVLKSELPDFRKQELIAKFLDLEEFEIQRSNQAKDLDYGDIYSLFKNNINLPRRYVDRMCIHPYTQHFYSDSEIDQIIETWTS